MKKPPGQSMTSRLEANWLRLTKTYLYKSASMIKPFIAQAYFFRHLENRRRFPYDAEIKRLLQAMLQNSHNGATNALINRISRRPRPQRPKAVERLLKHRARGIFRQTSIIEYIPNNGRTYRNKASAHDYSRFLYALWKKRLPYSEELINYMGLPNQDRITTSPALIKPYDKTGSTARLCGNMGILVAPGRDGNRYPYTVIGIIEKSRRAKPYRRWIADRGDVIHDVSTLIYQYMQQRHNLV